MYVCLFNDIRNNDKKNLLRISILLYFMLMKKNGCFEFL